MRSPNPKTENSIFTREYFLEEKDFLNQFDRENVIQPRPILEVSTYLRKQLEYLHLQFTSLLTCKVNE